MVETYLISTIYLLFYGLVGITTINIALIIALAILLSKQKKITILLCSGGWLFSIFSGNHFRGSHFLSILYTFNIVLSNSFIIILLIINYKIYNLLLLILLFFNQLSYLFVLFQLRLLEVSARCYNQLSHLLITLLSVDNFLLLLLFLLQIFHLVLLF